MSSNQKVQMYLNKHDITKLFEVMMAKLVKEMPNEPVTYLIKFLQKVYPKKVGEVLNPVLNNQIKLTGSSIPKKYSQDPQVILPGSKPLVSHWSKGVEEDENDVINQVVNSEQGIKEHKVENVNEIQDWKNNSKVLVKKLDDKKRVPATIKNEEKLSNSSDKKFKNTFEQEDWSRSKVNKASHVALSLDVNDELAINSNYNTKKITISPSTYTKFKKHSSKRKSVEQKKKLQALLSIEKQDDKKKQFIVESDEEVVENCMELISEGVHVQSNKRWTPLKRVDPSSGIRIGFCPQCKKLLKAQEEYLSTENDLFFEPNLQKEQVLSEDEEEEFESISQIGSKPCKLKWPTLSDSEGELVDTQTTKNLSILLKNSLKSDRSDFFEMNNPTRKQCNLKFTELNKKFDAVENLKVAQKSGSKQVWNVADADSETGDDRNETGLGNATGN